MRFCHQGLSRIRVSPFPCFLNQAQLLLLTIVNFEILLHPRIKRCLSMLGPLRKCLSKNSELHQYQLENFKLLMKEYSARILLYGTSSKSLSLSS